MPANSLKDRAGERACSDTRELASSTSQNQRRLKGHRWADSSSKWKDRREEGIMGDARRWNMPRLLLQTSRREGCPGKSIHAQHSAFNFLPHGQSPAVSPVTEWPDWRHCFLEQVSQTSRFFRVPLPCYTQALSNPIKSVQFWLSERAAREVFGLLSSHVPARTVQAAHH